jgi:hypothetical protein
MSHSLYLAAPRLLQLDTSAAFQLKCGASITPALCFFVVTTFARSHHNHFEVMWFFRAALTLASTLVVNAIFLDPSSESTYSLPIALPWI